MTIYLSVSDVYNINDAIMEGHVFVRDLHQLRSTVERPALHLFGEPQFPTLNDKAAALLHGLAYRHLFADGNKRTAVLAVTEFLKLNGVQPTWDEDEMQAFSLRIARGDLSVVEVARWLNDHTRTSP